MGFKLPTLFKASAALAMGILFVACLDVPDNPESSFPITRVSIYVQQGDTYDSTLLKINTNDSATIIAKVYPENYQKQVAYYWYSDSDLVDSGSSFAVSESILQVGSVGELFMPNMIIVRDSEGNEISKSFNVVTNTPPTVLETTTPADGDTLYGNSHTSFLFKWVSYDRDSGESPENILELDGVSYSVGELTELRESGLEIGRHRFRVITRDSYGDSDSTDYKTFVVVDTAGSVNE